MLARRVTWRFVRRGAELRLRRLRHSSAPLHPDLAQPTSPVQLDLDVRRTITDPHLVQNLTARGIAFDLKGFCAANEELSKLQAQWEDIETRRRENTRRMKSALDNGDEVMVNELKDEGKRLKAALKPLVRKLREVEDDVAMNALRLPNRLLDQTERNDVMERESMNGSLRHEQTFQNENLVFREYCSGKAYFTGQLAHLEQALCCYLTRRLDEAGFVAVVPPDLLKSVVVEGCARDPAQFPQLETKNVTEKEKEFSGNTYFLTGSSSMSMAAYFVRTVTDNTALPVRYQYSGKTFTNSSNGQSLLELNENFTTHIFLSGRDSADCFELMKESVDLLWEIYTDLDLPLTLWKVGAENLSLCESGRYEVRCFVPSIGEQVTLCSVSCVEEYWSRRLMMRIGGKQQQQQQQQREFRYHHVVHGKAMDCSKLMAAIMENHGGKIPGCLENDWIGSVGSCK